MFFSEVSGFEGYEYRGINSIRDEDFNEIMGGQGKKMVARDLQRLEHVRTWGDGYKFVPAIIEDEMVIYKHPDNDRVMLKAEKGLYYLGGVDWRQYKNR